MFVYEVQCTDDHRSLTGNRQKLETTQCPLAGELINKFFIAP